MGCCVLVLEYFELVDYGLEEVRFVGGWVVACGYERVTLFEVG